MSTPTREFDEQMIRRAIRLAMAGRGDVEPNPMVGCVIVKEGRIIGEGIHRKYGGPHAEPAALAACAESPTGSTAYVTLEPCCHLDKQTPPCVPRLIAAGVARVVVGCLDPNPEVNGKGIAILRGAGVTVDGPLCEAAAKQLIAPFLKRARGLPYVTMKWAQTADGKIAGAGGRRLQISGPAAMRAVHELRARCDAILVGVGTVIADDPRLTARGVEPHRPLQRYLLDTHLRTPPTAAALRQPGTTAIFCGPNPSSERRAALENAGAVINTVRQTGMRLDLSAVFQAIGKAGTTHVLVETGPRLANSMLAANVADRAWIIRSRAQLNNASAPGAASLDDRWQRVGVATAGDDEISEYLNTASDAFHDAEPSGDFQRIKNS